MAKAANNTMKRVAISSASISCVLMAGVNEVVEKVNEADECAIRIALPASTPVSFKIR